MGWWIGAGICFVIQLVWIIAVMGGVFRRKEKPFSKNSMFGYAFHGTFALLALWMFVEAMGQA